MRTSVVVSPLSFAIGVSVSTLIPRPLILKTSTTDEVHIFLVVSVTIDVYSFYIFCKTNMLFEKLMNTIQLSFDIVQLLISKSSGQNLPLKISVLCAIVGCQVLHESHNLFWIRSVEVSFTSSVQRHLICQRDASEEIVEQLHFIESMGWKISLIGLESHPRALE